MSYRPVIRVLLSGCAVLLTAANLWAIDYIPSWKPPEFVGFSSYDRQTSDRFLAHDHHGVPIIGRARHDAQNKISLVRRVTGVGWIDQSFSSVGGTGPTVAFDSHELPAMSYGDANGLHYVVYEPSVGGFTNYLVDDTSSSGLDWTVGGTSLAFDVYGRPGIAAHEGSGLNLHYVSDTNSDGVLDSSDTLELVDTSDEQRPSLAFDGLNRPTIVGTDPTGDVDFHAKDFVGWGTTTVSTTASAVQYNGSLAIDPDDGLPAVAWIETLSSSLHYSKWNDATLTWDDETVAVDPLTLFANASLAFDPGDGQPAISYADNSGNLLFSYFDGAAWNANNLVLNTGFLSNTRTSLSFNEFGDGYPAIAHVPDDPSTPIDYLLYIYDPPATVPEPAATWLAAIGVVFASSRTRRRHFRG